MSEPGKEPEAAVRQKARRPFTKRKAQSANEIGAWSGNEVNVGEYYLDKEEILRRAVKGELKSTKI